MVADCSGESCGGATCGPAACTAVSAPMLWRRHPPAMSGGMWLAAGKSGYRRPVPHPAYRLVKVAASGVGGLLASAVFTRAWRLVTAEDGSPDAADGDRAWPEVLLAGALRGAVNGMARAALERAGIAGYARITGRWPSG